MSGFLLTRILEITSKILKFVVNQMESEKENVRVQLFFFVGHR